MKPLVVVAIVLGVICLALTVLYWVTPAAALPAFLPGHDAAGTAVYHHKHAIGALVLALALFAFGWFQSKPKAAA
jgi:hypothetical protein